MDQLVSHVASVVMLVLGLSYLLATEHWVKLVREILETPHRFLVGALGLLAAGLVIVVAHNWWQPSLGVVVTVFGWILVLKGVAFLLFPQISRGVAGWSEGLLRTLVRVGGLALTVLGAVLTYVTWFAR